MRKRKFAEDRKGDAMGKPKTPERGGLCCPHCADSKFPCVTMEKQMRRGTEPEKENSPKKGE